MRFYKKQGYVLTLENLKDNEYRYLTTPSGNPSNFSYVTLSGTDGEFELRQQVTACVPMSLAAITNHRWRARI